MERIYLDYAASTPVDARVVKAIEPYFTELYGNPNSLHSFGQEAMAGVDAARKTLARSIGASSEELVFTGSATEANNLALRGVARATSISRPKIIISAIEHESVLDTAHDLEREGVEVAIIPVDEEGRVDLKSLEKELNERTVLVSVMYGNNEIGAIQPISEIAEILAGFRNRNFKFQISNFKLEKAYPLFHVDAVQAVAYLDCDVNKLGIDLMTLSAHKLYGPKGVGALYMRRQMANSKEQIVRKGRSDAEPFAIGHLPLAPLVTGGGQEFGMRSGTQNVPAIVGFGKAMELVRQERGKEEKRIARLREYFWHELKEIFPRAERNGPSKEGEVLPHILNVYFPGMRAEDMLIRLDMGGVAVSSGAACAARNAKPSHVLRAMGFSSVRVNGSLRFSFGRETTEKELACASRVVKKLFA